MKLYLAMCSLSLLTGLALGHINGKAATVSSLMEDCAAASVVVLEDTQGAAKRHFHCFEIDTSASQAHPAPPRSKPIPMV